MNEPKAPFKTHHNDNSNKYSHYAIPRYLAKNYWWAYLSPIGIKFFDSDFMVNRILWGQYHQIAQNTVEILTQDASQKIAGVSCAYGEFFPLLSQDSNVEKLYLFDVMPAQLAKIESKVANDKCELIIGNAEQAPIQTQVVDSSVLFFLLHELPTQVRANVLFEVIRMTKKAGRIVIADYAPKYQEHIFHRNKFLSSIFERLEPCLASFWRQDICEELARQATSQGREVKLVTKQYYFNQFYQLYEFSVN